MLVENNWITMTQGATGAYQDGEGNGIFTNQNNVFRNNHYCVASAIHPNDGYTFGWFAWMNNWLDFSGWQTSWLETAGTFRTGSNCNLSQKSLPREQKVIGVSFELPQPLYVVHLKLRQNRPGHQTESTPSSPPIPYLTTSVKPSTISTAAIPVRTNFEPT